MVKKPRLEYTVFNREERQFEYIEIERPLPPSPLSSEEYNKVEAYTEDQYGFQLYSVLKANFDRVPSVRKRYFVVEPSWLLYFKAPNHRYIRRLFSTTAQAIAVLYQNEEFEKLITFHSQTGVICDALIEYLQSLNGKNPEKVSSFIEDYHRYMRGGKLFFPRFRGGDSYIFRRLKAVSTGKYAKRLAEYYKKGIRKPTQDYTAIYAISPEALSQSYATNGAVSLLTLINENRK